VPHGLRPRALPSSESRPAVSLPVFPMYGEVTAGLEDLNVRVEKRPDGTIVSVRGQAKAKRIEEAPARLLARR
jgi:hypothetical protein